MTDNIPHATPYPWDDTLMEEEQRLSNSRLRKRPFVGSGFVALQKSSFGPNSTLSSASQSLMRGLLLKHDVKLDEEACESSPADKVFGSMSGASDSGSTKREAKDGMEDAEIQQLAKEGKLSLFLTILGIINDNSPGPVATKELFKTCCLAIRPGDVPGSMDAKEMVMAALLFMSRDCDIYSVDLEPLPIIRPAQELADLERRTFLKFGDWSFDDEFKQKILRLEQIFVSSPASWRWLKREFLSPRLTEKEEGAFFLKGAIPASAAGKKANTQTTSRKRKAAPQPEPAHSIAESVSESVGDVAVAEEASPSDSDS
mmetsp:Transcript_117965/g.341013  ORF Transcript_117965/g.341013 Transcript_117965/m.341013 type:complete len:315 (+) Transcript_117965:113-1057(+)